MTGKENSTNKKRYGLIGKNISYSFSSGYFQRKFEDLNLKYHQYHNFDIQSIDEFKHLIKDNDLSGLNVTIPYKQSIIPFLDELDETALKIGAVNTIQITKSGKLIGFNTDVVGFQKSLEPLLMPTHKKALILGTGGAALAIAFVLSALNISFLYVSRSPNSSNEISYKDVNEMLLQEYLLLINCTPLGTFPDVEKCPDIPYAYITNNHLLFDLIYNPSRSAFLENGMNKGATIQNGLEMLQLQAEESWKIWNS